MTKRQTSKLIDSQWRMFPLVIVLLISGTVAFAQNGGQVLWKTDVTYTPQTAAPRVAPGGNIYFDSDDFSAISPGGHILWTKDSGDPKAVDIGRDGTVYFGSFRSIFAYTPAGVLKWTFTEPPGGQGLMAGPTVGADGNIYAVSDAGGLGAFALNPDGQLLWNVPGYVNVSGTGLTKVPLGPNRLYFAEDTVPNCSPLTEGINATDLDGNLLWCVSISGVSRPVTAKNGDALVHDFGVLYDFTPDGSVAWSFSFPFPSGTLIGPSGARDGNIYIFHNYDNLWSFTPTGTKRWEVDAVVGNFPIDPTIAPDNKTVVFGTVYAFGKNGELVAVKASDGSVLWRIPITGPSAGAAGPVAFSADSKVVYAPVTEIGGDNKLWAVAVSGPTLTSSGACPGTATVTAAGLSANSSAQIWAGSRTGATTITSGACTGTVVGLGNAKLLVTKNTDSQGVWNLQLNLDSQSCGRLLQALDTTTCNTTNVGQLP